MRALVTHPDKGGTAAEFREVVLAFRVLSDPAARREYDQTSTKAAKSAAPAASATSTKAAGPKQRAGRKRAEVQTQRAPAKRRAGQGGGQRFKCQRCSPPSASEPNPAAGVQEAETHAPHREDSLLEDNAAEWLPASETGGAADGCRDSPSAPSRPRTPPAASVSGGFSSGMLRDLHSVVQSAPSKERQLLLLSLSHLVRAALLRYLESRCSDSAPEAHQSGFTHCHEPEKRGPQPHRREAAAPNAERHRESSPPQTQREFRRLRRVHHVQADAEVAWRRSKVAELVRLLEAALKRKPSPQDTRLPHTDPSLRQARLAWWRRPDLTMGDLLGGCPI